MHADHPHDAKALAELRKISPPSGLRLYTVDAAETSLRGWYRGRSAFLVLSGPSLAQLDLAQLSRRGIVSMGVNNSWTVHRPSMWTCVDGPGRFVDTGWKDPGIVKFVPVEHIGARLRVALDAGGFRPSQFTVRSMPAVWLFRRSDTFHHEKFLNQDTVSWGCEGKLSCSLGIKGKRSVMLVALNLLHYLGFRNVYLVGADFTMTPERKYAFDEGRTPAAIRHNNILYEALNRRFRALEPAFRREGFRVFNCTPGSSLDAFERMDYAHAIARAGAECSKAVRTNGWYEKVSKK